MEPPRWGAVATGPYRPASSGGSWRAAASSVGRVGLANVLLLVVATVTVVGSHGPAVGATPPAATQAVSALPRLGPAQVVHTDDVGDPYILPAPGGVHGHPEARYVLFWTTDWQSNVPTAVSSDMVHWTRIDDALPDLPSWATPNRTMTWAPSAQKVGSSWVLYYSTQEQSSGLECIGAARSSDPAGPYVDNSTLPLVCPRGLGGAIDPSVVHTPAGALLVWKNDGNATHSTVGVWQQPLTADGAGLTGSPVRLLAADEAWQGGIIEGPSMLAASHGGWWLFYSGGSWLSNSYATGVAFCATVAGPCRETSARPFLAGLPTSVSPGGLETFTDNSGVLWASWSAFPSAPANAEDGMAMNRVLEIAPVASH